MSDKDNEEKKPVQGSHKSRRNKNARLDKKGQSATPPPEEPEGDDGKPGMVDRMLGRGKKKDGEEEVSEEATTEEEGGEEETDEDVE